MKPLDRIAPMRQSLDIARLEKVHNHGQKTIARCPACAEEGRDKSGDHLVIEPDGRFGCVMHKGQEGKSHRRRIYELAGVPSDHRILLPAVSQRHQGRHFATMDEAIHALEKEIGAACSHRWRYDHAHGGAAFVICRFEARAGKTYRPVTNEPGGWRIGSMEHGTRPLYRLPELIQAGPEQRVFVAEGEKCADALADLGLVATTSSHGAKSADGTNWSLLAGREVVLLPDHDKPGEGYAQTVSRLLAGLTPPASLRVLTLPGIEALGDGADVVDWLPNREPEQAREELLRLASETPAEPVSPAMSLIASAADWLMEPAPSPPDFLLDGVFERQDKVLIVGPPKTRKSYLTLQLALCLAAGVPFVGIAVPHSCLVMLVDLENKIDGIKRRLRQIAGGLGLACDRVSSLKILAGLDESYKSLEVIVEQAHSLHPDVILIDPVYKLDQDDENDQASRKRLLARLGDLSSKIGCAVVLIHHDPKGDSSLRDVRDRGSGSNVLNRDVDATLAIRLKPRQKRIDADQELEILARNAPPGPPRRIHFEPAQYFVAVGTPLSGESANPVSTTSASEIKVRSRCAGTKQRGMLAKACSILTAPVPITKYCVQLSNTCGVGKKTARDLAEAVGAMEGYAIVTLPAFPRIRLIGPREAVELEVARHKKN